MKIGLQRDGRITALALEVTQAGGALRRLRIITILYTGRADARHLPTSGDQATPGAFMNLPPCGDGATTARWTRAPPSRRCSPTWRPRSSASTRFAVRQKNLLPQIPYRTMYAQNMLSYGLPECLEKVKAASGWESARASAGARPQAGVLALRLGHLDAQALDRRAARRGAVAAGLRRQRDAVHRRRRHRPGLEHDGRAVRRRGAAGRAAAHPRRLGRQRAVTPRTTAATHRA